MKTHQSLQDGELAIMQIVWRQTPPVSRSAIEHAMSEKRTLAPSTILTFLSRLCDRGFLAVAHAGRTNLYTPLISEKDYLAGERRRLLDLRRLVLLLHKPVWIDKMALVSVHLTLLPPIASSVIRTYAISSMVRLFLKKKSIIFCACFSGIPHLTSLSTQFFMHFTFLLV